MVNSIISSVISTFGLPPLHNTKMSANHMESNGPSRKLWCHLIPSLLRIIPIVLKTTTLVRTEMRAIFDKSKGRTWAFQLLFLTFGCRKDDKMTSWEGSRNINFSAQVVAVWVMADTFYILLGNLLRATDRKYQKSHDRQEISDFILFPLNVPFGELFSKITIKSSTALSFF